MVLRQFDISLPKSTAPRSRRFFRAPASAPERSGVPCACAGRFAADTRERLDSLWARDRLGNTEVISGIGFLVARLLQALHAVIPSASSAPCAGKPAAGR